MRTLVFVLSLALFISCSKKEEPPMQQEKQPTSQQEKQTPMTEAEKFAMLPETRVAELLAGAKAATQRTSKPKAVLSEDDINDILAIVANTQVEQVADNEIAVLETNMGVIAIAFYTSTAPEHTKGFKRLVTTGFYDGTRFHRVIDGFVIQGGDILTRDNNPDNDGTGGPGYNLPAEFSGIPHDLGILSMARSQDPNSAGSQFFICLSRQGTAGLDGKYTVFGKVIGGLDIVQKIGKVATAANRWGEKSVPTEPVYIKNAYMVTR